MAASKENRFLKPLKIMTAKKIGEKNMSEVTLKDKMAELTSIVKNVEAFKSKNPELVANLQVLVSYDNKVYARISEGEEDLNLELY